MNTFTHKGYGRIYVEKPDDILRVMSIIKEMDEYEFGYLPDQLITTFDQYPKVVYTHKFNDLDTDSLTATCWDRGIRIWVFDAHHTEYQTNGICKIKSIEQATERLP